VTTVTELILKPFDLKSKQALSHTGQLLRVISFNMNGIRSSHDKGFFEWLAQAEADFVCVQEIKADESVLARFTQTPCGMTGFFYPAQKKGYSGVGVYTRQEPISVEYGMGHELFDAEGRWIVLHFGKYIVVSVYFPSGSSGDERQAAKFEFLRVIEPVLERLQQQQKPVIVCGDINIAHQNIDIKNWKSNQKNSGFLPEERDWVTQLYARGWLDCFRLLEPNKEQYTWWSQRGQARAKNVGWRIDYQWIQDAASNSTSVVAEHLIPVDTFVEDRYMFSDHAPLIVDYQLV